MMSHADLPTGSTRCFALFTFVPELRSLHYLSYTPDYAPEAGYLMSQAEEKDKMGVALQVGHTLKGKLNSYTLTQKLYRSVWKAT